MEQLSGEIQFQLVNYLIMHQAHVYHNSKSLHFKQHSNANANFTAINRFSHLFFFSQMLLLVILTSENFVHGHRDI